MITVEQLINKGFELIKYEDQIDQPEFYSLRYDDESDIVKLAKFLGEVENLESDYVGMYGMVEITKDLMAAQYLISEKVIDSGYFTYGDIKLEDFERLLLIL